MVVYNNPKVIQSYKLIKFFFISSIIYWLILNNLNINSIADIPSTDLEIYNISFSEPIIEGDNIKLGILIHNNGSVALDRIIEDKLYIDKGNNLVSKNSSNLTLSAGAFIYLNLSWIAEVGEHTFIIKLFYDGNRVDKQDVVITINERKVDLKFNGIYIPKILRLDQPIDIFANTTNIGKNTSKTVIASLYIDGKHEQSNTIDGLLRGKTYNFSFEWIPKHFDYHTINVTLDSENKIKEENENNNFFEIEKYIEPYRVEWESPNWHYRKFYSIKGTGNISIYIDFTEILEENLSVIEKTFDNDSIMIVKYLSTGNVDSKVKEFYFQESDTYNNKTNASGILLWKVTEEISYYCVYFDVIENNNTRKKYVETDGMIESGDATVNRSFVEGWWPEFITPNYNYYPRYVKSSIRIITVAKVSVVTAELSLKKGGYEFTITFNSSDNINWIKKHTFSKKGTWVIEIIAEDEAGNISTNVTEFSVLAVPDLAVEYIILPNNTIEEGEKAHIRAVINNTGYADARNYSIGLYLSQARLTWSDSELENTTEVSIEKDESEEINLTWYPAIYGDSGKKGKWRVGIWIYTNSTFKDSNSENNKGTKYSLFVVTSEKDAPLIKIIELTNRQEIGKPIRIVAEIIDESGINSVNITIIDPKNNKYINNMIRQENNKYIYEFDNTLTVGEYNFSITATDNSFYLKKSKFYGTFEIIEDATLPSIDYFNSYPSVQLKGGYVNISCISSDFMGLKVVRVIIYYPDNHSQTIIMTMSTSDGKYIYSQTYEILGKYTFYIISEDNSGNKRKTEDKEFWITNDINDTDNDGMPDSWEERYGFDPYDPTDSKQDEDGDGYTNFQEYKSGYNPLKHLSSLKEIVYKFRENWNYLIVSVIFFVLIIVLSLQGIKRLKNGNN